MKVLTVLSIAALATVAMADLKSSTKGVYEKVGKAFMKKDVKAFEAATRPAMTKNFKCVQQGKTMNYTEMLADLRVTLGQLSKVTAAKASMVSAKEMGNKANSVSTHSISGTMVGPDKKSHKIEMRGTSNDTWVKEGKTWKMASMTWVKQSMTMDGKPFNPGAPVRPKTPGKG